MRSCAPCKRAGIHSAPGLAGKYIGTLQRSDLIRVSVGSWLAFAVSREKHIMHLVPRELFSKCGSLNRRGRKMLTHIAKHLISQHTRAHRKKVCVCV